MTSIYNTTLQLPATTEKNNKCAILVTILSSCLVTQRLNKLTPMSTVAFCGGHHRNDGILA